MAASLSIEAASLRPHRARQAERMRQGFTRRPHAPRWDMSEAERAFYDAATDQIADYALQNDINERFLLAQSQRFLASSLASAYRHWGERSGTLELDEEDDEDNDSKRRPKNVPGYPIILYTRYPQQTQVIDVDAELEEDPTEDEAARNTRVTRNLFPVHLNIEDDDD